jgi:hypothetical protein
MTDQVEVWLDADFLERQLQCRIPQSLHHGVSV